MLKLEPKTFLGLRQRRWASADLCIDLSHYSAGCVFPQHEHTNAFFCFVLEGICEEHTDGCRAILRPGSLVYHPAGFGHSDHWQENGRCLHVELTPQFYDGVVSARLSEPVIQTHCGRAGDAAHRIYEELLHPDAASSIAFEGLALLLLAETIRGVGNERNIPRWLRRVHERLYEEYVFVPPLKQIATEAGVHSAYLATSFQQHFGVSIGEFVRSRRIAHARELLRHSDQPLSEVALLLGFSDQSHFCRTFKKQTGFTPREYRRFFQSISIPFKNLNSVLYGSRQNRDNKQCLQGEDTASYDGPTRKTTDPSSKERRNMMLFRLFALGTLLLNGSIQVRVAPFIPSQSPPVDTVSRTQIQVIATNLGVRSKVSGDPAPQATRQAKPDTLDKYILADMKARHIPAVVFGVFKDGKMLRSGAYKHSNLELGVHATTETVFEIGSVSKQFTATLILKLMEEGKLSLDDPIGKFVDALPAEWRQIKLRNLLNHTSGIPDIEEIFGYDSYRNHYTVAEIIKVANSRSVAFAAGTKWQYSNTNYYLLALVIQIIDHKTYSQSLKDRIFKPLVMMHTRESDPWVVIPNRAAGYMLTDGGEIVNRDPMQPTACLGAGTIISTIGDMAKWDDAITHHRILRRDSQELMWTPTKLIDGSTAEYGFGWFNAPWYGHPSVEHSGGTAGFSCDYRRFTDSGISVMVFTNLFATGVGDYEIRAVDTIQPGTAYFMRPVLSEDDAAVRTRLLAGMKDVASGATTSMYISPKMMERYNAISRADWKTRLEEMVRLELVAHEKYAPKDAGNGEIVSETYIYRLTLRKATLIITFKLTPDGRVAWQTRSDY